MCTQAALSLRDPTQGLLIRSPRQPCVAATQQVCPPARFLLPSGSGKLLQFSAAYWLSFIPAHGALTVAIRTRAFIATFAGPPLEADPETSMR